MDPFFSTCNRRLRLVCWFWDMEGKKSLTLFVLVCSTEERQKLADAVKQHQSRQHSVPAQPEGKQLDGSQDRSVHGLRC